VRWYVSTHSRESIEEMANKHGVTDIERAAARAYLKYKK
jgi:hypothetical protein